MSTASSGRLAAVRAVAAMRAQRTPATPLDLARMCFPNYVVTPSLALISDVLVDAVQNPDRRYIVSTPPRSGKSVLVSQVLPVWALARDPNAEIILKSYADDLAEEHSREARRLIAEHGDTLGISLSTGKASVGRWRLEGRRGGMLAGGILTGTTGFGANLLIVDDPIKSAVEADSAAYRRRLINEFRSSLLTRLHPGASAIVVLTRWNEHDLAGELLAAGGWTQVNIPAIAESGVPDALARAPGVAMTSALGRSAIEYAEIRKAVGERAWWALYEGVPASPEGGLIKRDWLDTWRLPAAPPHSVKTVVGVDPSDSGSGDACGVVAASIASDGTVAVIADVSAPMTSDQWARAAVELAMDVGASEIGVEGFAARETYVRVVKDALSRYAVTRPIKVTSWPPKGSGRGGGDAIARSSALLQALEVGTCRIAGHLPELEDAAVTWQQGQHQPDALAALVVAHDLLVHAIGQRATFTNPARAGQLRERGSDRFARRFDPRDLASVTPINSRLTRRISGGGYDALDYQRQTRRGF